MSIGVVAFSAPSLFTVEERTYLLATRVTGFPGAEQYSGCVLIAFSDRHSGSLERNRAGNVFVRQLLPTDANRFGGACAWDPHAASGILMSQLSFDGASPSFRICATRATIPPP